MADRTLLLTGFPPDSRSGGAVIVRSLAARFAPGTLDWLAFVAPSSPLPAPHDNQYIGALPVPPSMGNSRPAVAWFWWWWKELVSDRRAARRLRRLIVEKNYRTVWMVLDHPRAGIAASLVRMLPGTRFHFSVHDHPVHSAVRENMPRALARRIHDDLDFLSSSGSSVDAVTEEMFAELDWHGAGHAVVTAGVDAGAAEERLRGPGGGTLRVACIGNHVAFESVMNLVGGLESWSRSAGRPWQLTIYGRTDLPVEHPNVAMHGYTDLAKERQQVLENDLFLLPMGFHADEIEQMMTCLPTKLVTYLELGRLIIAYAPAGSATQRIMRDNNLGPVVSDLDPASAVRAIESALSWDLKAANAGRDELLADRFAEDRVFERFLAAFGRSGVE